MKRSRTPRVGAWQRIVGTLWFVPAVCTVAAGLLGILSIRIDRAVADVDAPWLAWLVYDVGAEGARGILSSISGAIVTVTGVVFSVTVVTLQLASTQYTPRVLQGFIRDRWTQLVLGTLLGTFAFCLVVLRTVRAGDDEIAAFVPSVSVTLAVVLALASTAMLIAFVHHIVTSIQATQVLLRATRETLATIEQLFPDQLGAPVADEPRPQEQAVMRGPGHAVVANESGFILTADEDQLWSVGDERHLVVRMERAIGEFVIRGEPLATVWPADAGRDEEIEAALRRAFVLGPARTAESDVERGIVQIVDIAVRALSPGVNDPTTAAMCLERLGEVLAALGSRRMPPAVRTGPGGEIRFIAVRTDFERAVRLAFEPIRHHGASDPAIVDKLLEMARRVADLVPAERRAPLLAVERAVAAPTARIADPAERGVVRSSPGG